MSSNDNDLPARAAPHADGNAHGQAALLLVESLIHGLCERSTISLEAAIAIVDRAAEVQADLAAGANSAAPPMWRSHALLSMIAKSLQADGCSETGGVAPEPAE